MPIRLVIISDTHGLHRRVSLPEGDILIHCGDFMNSGRYIEELSSFNTWLGEHPFKHRVVVPGNHDLLVMREPAYARKLLSNATLLIDESITIEGIKMHGCPYTPEFFNWAFMEARNSPAMRHHWKLAEYAQPDILISHGPPHGILDQVKQKDCKYYRTDEEHLGCEVLRESIPFINPKINCFGHIHSSHGEDKLEGLDTRFINASQVDETYKVVYSPVVIDH